VDDVQLEETSVLDERGFISSSGTDSDCNGTAEFSSFVASEIEGAT